MILPIYCAQNISDFILFLTGVCVSLALLALGFQLADSNTPAVTVIEDNDDPCHSYKVCMNSNYYQRLLYVSNVP